MEVSAIFDTEYHGDAAGAVWLVATEINREWFNRQSDLDPNSALFFIDRYGTKEEAVCHMVWNIQEHFDDWETIHVTGIALSQLLVDELQNDGHVVITCGGFDLCK